MARLEIRRRAAAEQPRKLAGGWAYQVLVDGREIADLISVSLDWEQGGVPAGRIEFLVSDLDIDSDALVELCAHAARRQVQLPEAALEQIVGEVLARMRRAEG